MQNRPAVWNGVQVPYGATVEELAHLVDGPIPARWAAFVALAHTSGEPALAVLRASAESPNPHVRRIAVEAIGIRKGIVWTPFYAVCFPMLMALSSGPPAKRRLSST